MLSSRSCTPATLLSCRTDGHSTPQVLTVKPSILRVEAPMCCGGPPAASGRSPSTIRGAADHDSRRRAGTSALMPPAHPTSAAVHAGTRTDIGYLLAKASQRWNDLLAK